MPSRILGNFLLALILVFFQVSVLNRIDFSGWAFPVIYPLALLILPFRMSHALLMLSAFVLGLIVDWFSNSPGFHTSALVFMAWIRPRISQLISPPSGYEDIEAPRMGYLGFSWFLTYSGILLLMHQLFLFVLEAFRWSGLGMTFLKALISGLISISLIVLLELIISPQKKRR
jgi:hypothetical protein